MILVADDSPDNSVLMEYLLTARGHEVRLAADGAEAVRLAKTLEPDLVLMDIQMPVMDGYQALRGIRGLGGRESPPVVAVTAGAMVGDREKVLAAGFSGYIRKPIAPETFVDEVEALLEGGFAGGYP